MRSVCWRRAWFVRTWSRFTGKLTSNLSLLPLCFQPIPVLKSALAPPSKNLTDEIIPFTISKYCPPIVKFQVHATAFSHPIHLWHLADCRMTYAGHHYAGNQNVTKSGFPCQSWASTIPHYNYYVDSTYFPEMNSTLAGNRCRNPDYNWHGGFWCYTTDPEKRWEVCEGVPYCGEVSCCF